MILNSLNNPNNPKYVVSFDPFGGRELEPHGLQRVDGSAHPCTTKKTYTIDSIIISVIEIKYNSLKQAPSVFLKVL